MSEIPFFFERDKVQFFGFLHKPDDSAGATGFVMSHPFGEEKLWSHRVFVSFARVLAARGFPVLRFDYQGAGDSSGESSTTSISTYVEDLRRAIEVLGESCPLLARIGVVGLRLGATIGAKVFESSNNELLRKAPLILWDPIPDGKKYFQELLRVNLGTQLAVYGKIRVNREDLQAQLRAGRTVNVDGYEVGYELFQSCAISNLLTAEPKTHEGPVLVLQIAGSENQKDRADLRQLCDAYPTSSFARAIEQPFWREIKPFYGRASNLQEATLSWLEAQNV